MSKFETTANNIVNTGPDLANRSYQLFNHHNGAPINSLAVSADGQIMVSGSENGTITAFR